MQEAAELYESLAQQDPANAETWQKLGFAYQKNKLYDKAVKAYVQADALKANHLWTLKHLAQCHKLSGNYSQAAFCFQKVLEFDPDNLHILMQTGQCLAALKNYPEAIKVFYKVEFLETHPEKHGVPSDGATSCPGNTKKLSGCMKSCSLWKTHKPMTG